MQTTKFDSNERRGKLIALEGDSDIISTQLRLLPPSPKILIIPTIFESLPEPAENAFFDARAFVRDVHVACRERTAIARSFLSQSTSKHPRIVFMNGGSVHAHAACITKICENITNGEMLEAEAIFNNIIKDGAVSLMWEEDTEGISIASTSVSPPRVPEEVLIGDARNGTEEMVSLNTQTVNQEPTQKAMQEAEWLDEETASLQPRNDISVLRYYQDVSSKPKDVATFPEHQERTVVAAEDTSTDRADDTILESMITVSARRSIYGPRPAAPTNRILIIPHQDPAEDDNLEDPRSHGDEFMDPGVSVPNTPSNVVFGEACIVDVHGAMANKRLRTVASFDQFIPRSSRIGKSSDHRVLSRSVSCNSLNLNSITLGDRRSSLSYYETMPRTTFMRAAETTIRRSPTWDGGSALSDKSTKLPSELCADRGSRSGGTTPVAAGMKVEPYEPVFSIAEDFVIHFSDDSENQIVDSVLQYFRDGSLPLLYCPSPYLCTPSLSSDRKTTESPSTEEIDTSDYFRHDGSKCQKPISPAESTFISAAQLSGSHKQSDGTAEGELPTTSLTPPPSAHGSFQRYQEFVADSKSAIDVQNSLRSILSLHVPTSDGFSQHHYNIIPEANRLWKPVFESEDLGSQSNEGTNVDHILALGREEGVDRDFFLEVSGQVERLGTRRDAASRSGCLDLRYIIANALDSFTAHHVSSLDPTSDPALLAALIVPHIESYLATNYTRFLIIHYSNPQLPVILALQALLGSTLFKIAGIFHRLPSDTLQPGFGFPPSLEASPIHSKFSTGTQPIRPNSTAKRERILTEYKYRPNGSCVGADYVLSTAPTASEFTRFISSIREVLIEKDGFYKPNLEQESTFKLNKVSKKMATIAQQNSRNLPRTPPQSPARAPELSAPYQEPSRLQERSTTTRGSIRRLSRTLSSKKVQFKPAKVTGSEPPKKDDAYERQLEKEWDNFNIDEEDSEDDDYDRMVLGRAGVTPDKLQYLSSKSTKAKALMMENGKRKKPSDSKKALRWLGLA
ncbi:gastric mucin-like protein [Phlyctema vagabunda]|uniref:Gastric mucin-like protein n=1 Tax=Phlyctema vagabunda TaxID=108571 RepID=A0ABR4PW53_9HELO